MVNMSMIPDDIDEAEPSQPKLCPVARCICRYIKNDFTVAVGTTKLFILKDEKCFQIISLPKKFKSLSICLTAECPLSRSIWNFQSIVIY